MSDALHLDITVKKSHVAVLSVVVLVASASAAVNIRDPMNVFGDIDMQGNEIQNTSKVELNPDYLKEIAKGGENDNKIEPFELLDAIERYRNGELAANKLSVAIKYFQNSEPVTSGNIDLQAAPMNSKGKIIATGAKLSNGENIQLNFTFDNNINMKRNEITNTTEVEFSSDYLKDYANTEGRIDIEGTSRAAADYFDGEISHEQLRTVETFFFNEVPVKNNILEEYDDDNSGQLDVQEVSDASADFIDGELSEGEIELITYYFLNEVPITEPASSIDAAKITSSGKLIASGIIGRQKANFTIGNDINMRSNKIQNAGNYKFTPSYLREYAKTHGNDNTIQPQDIIDAITDYKNGEITENQIATVILYFKNGREVSSGLRAAPMTDNGKLAATGVKLQGTTQGEGIQPPNFTLSTDINMQGNNIYNAANLNGNTGGGGGLEWGQLYQVSDSSSTEARFDGETVTASVSCDTGDVLVSATCEGKTQYGKAELVECDTRSRDEAAVSQSGQDSVNIGATVTGTCVPGGQQTQTDTITIDASGQTGAVETYQLDREYDNVVKVEWTGGGIQPADASGGPGPSAEGFGDEGTPWFVYVADSSSGSQSTVASHNVEIKPSDFLGTISSPEWYGYPPDTEPSQPSGVRNPVYKLPDGSQMQNNYVKEFASASVDSVKLRIPADHQIGTDSGDPTVEEELGQLDWTGSEEIKITYYPEN